VPGRRVCLATAAVSLWHLLSAPRVPLCVFVCVFCFFAARLGLALQAPGAHLHGFAYVWWNVLRVLVMFSSFSVFL